MAHLSVGDTIQNEITLEEGLIVRIVKVDGRVGYVVAVANKLSGNEFEALWHPQELRTLRNRNGNPRASRGERRSRSLLVNS
jgi:hypothetical protein